MIAGIYIHAGETIFGFMAELFGSDWFYYALWMD